MSCLQLPSRTELPAYYQRIKDPIDFVAIDKRITRDDYPTFDDCVNEFMLMWDNATTFNASGSEVRRRSQTTYSLKSPYSYRG